MNEIVQSNWFTNFGPREREFRRGIAEYVGDDSTAVTFANATLALTVAMSQLVGARAPGYVLLPSFTFAAGAHAIRWAGHEPLLLDIDLDTLQPSLESAYEAFDTHGDQIAGILYCNTFGIGGEVDAWEALARRHGVPLIIDSAAGFGSRYPNGEKLGNRGTCEIFSFHATKPFAIGEGGAALTHDPSLAERLLSASNFGFSGAVGAHMIGTNAKLQEMNAAIGIRQLRTFDDALAARRKHLQRYHDTVTSYSSGHFPSNDLQSSVCFASVVLPTSDMRDGVLNDLRSAGVEARIYYSPPLHQQPFFCQSERVGSLEVTASVHSRILSLPVFPSLPEHAFDCLAKSLARHACRL
ncbi:DegT/DnrJ/EryC1/StrS family aminotransferase [Humibacter ginsengiterrae]